MNPVVRRTKTFTLSLTDLYRHYHKELFEDILPFWDRHGVDHDLGGIICALDHEGNVLDSTKFGWYNGRAIWVYSFLYNNISQDAKHLKIATRIKNFVLTYFRAEKNKWYTSVSKEGEPDGDIDEQGYTGLFIAEGLQEHSKATGNIEDLERAVEILYSYIDQTNIPGRKVKYDHIPKCFKGMHSLGEHVIPLRLMTGLLRHPLIGKTRHRPKLNILVSKYVNDIMTKFYSPKYNLVHEVLTYYLRAPDMANKDFFYLGHALEGLWFIMDEALRQDDKTMFNAAARYFKRHLEVSWDVTFGGCFRGLKADNNSYLTDKVAWVQQEVLIGLMLLIEHSDSSWPAEWFEKLHNYCQEHFTLKRHGYHLWKVGGDRQASFAKEYCWGPHKIKNRKENYHHPRYVMLNMLSVRRMLKTKGIHISMSPGQSDYLITRRGSTYQYDFEGD